MQNFYLRFLQLAGVNILSNLMVPLAGLADVAFLGHLSEIRHLAGVALATVIFNYLYWTFGFLRMGTTGMTAQALGQGDRDRILLIALRHGILALGLGLILILLQQPLQILGFAVMSAAPEVKAAGTDYYHALIWGAPATLLNFVIMGSLLGQKRGRAVFVLSVVGNGVNVILDYFMVVCWAWESRGAGASTALSQYVTLFIGLGIVSRAMNKTQITALAGQIWDPSALQATISLNRDILLRTLALVSTFALFTNLSASLGTVTLAANTLLLQVVTLAAYFIDGIAFATESFAGALWGQMQADSALAQQLSRLLRLAISLALVCALSFAIAVVQFPRVLGILTNHLSVIQQAHKFGLWLVPVLLSGAIAYILDGYFLGLTQGRILRQSSLLAAGLGFLPMALVASHTQNGHLLWLALTLFMAGRILTLGLWVPITLSGEL